VADDRHSAAEREPQDVQAREPRERAPANSSNCADAPATATGEASDTARDARGDESLEPRLRRALADLDNVRKRYERELVRERAAERARVAAEWLLVVDNLERALEHADGDATAIVDGVRAVHDEALEVLARLGFSRFDDVGRPFDPTRDEAVGAVAADLPPGTVVATIRPGYGNGETILRPAAVMVAKGSH
jgi:molecular chaperone GrpE